VKDVGSGQRGPLPSQLGLQSSVLLGQVEDLPRGKPLARSGDGIPQSYLAISKTFMAHLARDIET
jgi:hypothetical protein